MVDGGMEGGEAEHELNERRRKLVERIQQERATQERRRLSTRETAARRARHHRSRRAEGRVRRGWWVGGRTTSKSRAQPRPSVSLITPDADTRTPPMRLSLLASEPTF